MRDYEECRPYINHLLSEHRRLHGMLAKTRAAVRQMNGPDHDATLKDVARVLMQVRSELVQHFREEEQGGCMEEAVSRCPRLADDAKRIQTEHSTLLAELDRLIAASKDGPENFSARFAVERGFDELCSQLHAHEAAENAILRDAFGSGVNGDEYEHVQILDY
jgi:iron-sulfur cluster repair protein YtfE (RIC family)